MNVVTPKTEIIEQKSGLQGIYEQIELAGRVCYASEHNIKYDEEGNSTTAEGFVDRLIKSRHTSVLEHGTVYLKFSTKLNNLGKEDSTWLPEGDYFNNPYSRVITIREVVDSPKYLIDPVITHYFITTNMRVLVENDWLEDLKYLCEPTEYHEKRVTVRFTTDIGITREANRHRKNSISESSTRYCNYANDRFGNELSICSNSDFNEEEIKKKLKSWNYPDRSSAFYNMCDHIAHYENEEQFEIIDYWLFANLASEWSYMNLIRLGWKPQQARRILPLDTKSELIHTAFISDWEHFFRLRSSLAETGQPHPDMKFLIDPLYKEFVSRNYIELLK